MLFAFARISIEIKRRRENEIRLNDRHEKINHKQREGKEEMKKKKTTKIGDLMKRGIKDKGEQDNLRPSLTARFQRAPHAFSCTPLLSI